MSTSLEARLLDILLISAFTTSNSSRRRQQFIRQVLGNLLTMSSFLLFALGYRKGILPHYSFIAAGLTYLTFWAIIQCTSNAKIDLTTISVSQLVITFIISLFGESLGLSLAIMLSSAALMVAILTVISIFWFALLALALTRAIQMLFGRHQVSLPTATVPDAVFFLLLHISILFVFYQFQLSLWHNLKMSGLAKLNPLSSIIEQLWTV